MVCNAKPGGILFGVPVNVNFAAVDAALTQVNNINGLNFGDIAGVNATARVAVNTTDNGDTLFGVGDSIKVVGHGLIDHASRSLEGR